MLRHLEALPASFVGALVRPDGQMTLEMLPLLRHFHEALRALVDAALDVRASDLVVVLRDREILLQVSLLDWAYFLLDV